MQEGKAMGISQQDLDIMYPMIVIATYGTETMMGTNALANGLTTNPGAAALRSHIAKGFKQGADKMFAEGGKKVMTDAQRKYTVRSVMASLTNVGKSTMKGVAKTWDSLGKSGNYGAKAKAWFGAGFEEGSEEWVQGMIEQTIKTGYDYINRNNPNKAEGAGLYGVYDGSSGLMENVLVNSQEHWLENIVAGFIGGAIPGAFITPAKAAWENDVIAYHVVTGQTNKIRKTINDMANNNEFSHPAVASNGGLLKAGGQEISLNERMRQDMNAQIDMMELAWHNSPLSEAGALTQLVGGDMALAKESLNLFAQMKAADAELAKIDANDSLSEDEKKAKKVVIEEKQTVLKNRYDDIVSGEVYSNFVARTLINKDEAIDTALKTGKALTQKDIKKLEEGERWMDEKRAEKVRKSGKAFIKQRDGSWTNYQAEKEAREKKRADIAAWFGTKVGAIKGDVRDLAWDMDNIRKELEANGYGITQDMANKLNEIIEQGRADVFGLIQEKTGIDFNTLDITDKEHKGVMDKALVDADKAIEKEYNDNKVPDEDRKESLDDTFYQAEFTKESGEIDADLSEEEFKAQSYQLNPKAQGFETFDDLMKQMEAIEKMEGDYHEDDLAAVRTALQDLSDKKFLLQLHSQLSSLEDAGYFEKKHLVGEAFGWNKKGVKSEPVKKKSGIGSAVSEMADKAAKKLGLKKEELPTEDDKKEEELPAQRLPSSLDFKVKRKVRDQKDKVSMQDVDAAKAIDYDLGVTAGKMIALLTKMAAQTNYRNQQHAKFTIENNKIRTFILKNIFKVLNYDAKVPLDENKPPKEEEIVLMEHELHKLLSDPKNLALLTASPEYKLLFNSQHGRTVDGKKGNTEGGMSGQGSFITTLEDFTLEGFINTGKEQPNVQFASHYMATYMLMHARMDPKKFHEHFFNDVLADTAADSIYGYAHSPEQIMITQQAMSHKELANMPAAQKAAYHNFRAATMSHAGRSGAYNPNIFAILGNAGAGKSTFIFQTLVQMDLAMNNVKEIHVVAHNAALLSDLEVTAKKAGVAVVKHTHDEFMTQMKDGTFPKGKHVYIDEISLLTFKELKILESGNVNGVGKFNPNDQFGSMVMIGDPYQSSGELDSEINSVKGLFEFSHYLTTLYRTDVQDLGQALQVFRYGLTMNERKNDSVHNKYMYHKDEATGKMKGVQVFKDYNEMEKEAVERAKKGDSIIIVYDDAERNDMLAKHAGIEDKVFTIFKGAHSIQGRTADQGYVLIRKEDIKSKFPQEHYKQFMLTALMRFKDYAGFFNDHEDTPDSIPTENIDNIKVNKPITEKAKNDDYANLISRFEDITDHLRKEAGGMGAKRQNTSGNGTTSSNSSGNTSIPTKKIIPTGEQKVSVDKIKALDQRLSLSTDEKMYQHTNGDEMARTSSVYDDPNKSFGKSAKTAQRRGTLVHAVAEEILNSERDVENMGIMWQKYKKQFIAEFASEAQARIAFDETYKGFLILRNDLEADGSYIMTERMLSIANENLRIAKYGWEKVSGIGGTIDVIVIAPDGTAKVVDFKTSGARHMLSNQTNKNMNGKPTDAYSRSNGMSKSPAGEVIDSYQERHSRQLILYAAMLEYMGIPMTNAMIYHVYLNKKTTDGKLEFVDMLGLMELPTPSQNATEWFERLFAEPAETVEVAEEVVETKEAEPEVVETKEAETTEETIPETEVVEVKTTVKTTLQEKADALEKELGVNQDVTDVTSSYLNIANTAAQLLANKKKKNNNSIISGNHLSPEEEEVLFRSIDKSFEQMRLAVGKVSFDNFVNSAININKAVREAFSNNWNTIKKRFMNNWMDDTAGDTFSMDRSIQELRALGSLEAWEEDMVKKTKESKGGEKQEYVNRDGRVAMNAPNGNSVVYYNGQVIDIGGGHKIQLSNINNETGMLTWNPIGQPGKHVTVPFGYFNRDYGNYAAVRVVENADFGKENAPKLFYSNNEMFASSVGLMWTDWEDGTPNTMPSGEHDQFTHFHQEIKKELSNSGMTKANIEMVYIDRSYNSSLDNVNKVQVFNGVVAMRVQFDGKFSENKLEDILRKMRNRRKNPIPKHYTADFVRKNFIDVIGMVPTSYSKGGKGRGGAESVYTKEYNDMLDSLREKGKERLQADHAGKIPIGASTVLPVRMRFTSPFQISGGSKRKSKNGIIPLGQLIDKLLTKGRGIKIGVDALRQERDPVTGQTRTYLYAGHLATNRVKIRVEATKLIAMREEAIQYMDSMIGELDGILKRIRNGDSNAIANLNNSIAMQFFNFNMNQISADISKGKDAPNYVANIFDAQVGSSFIKPVEADGNKQTVFPNGRPRYDLSGSNATQQAKNLLGLVSSLKESLDAGQDMNVRFSTILNDDGTVTSDTKDGQKQKYKYFTTEYEDLHMPQLTPRMNMKTLYSFLGERATPKEKEIPSILSTGKGKKGRRYGRNKRGTNKFPMYIEDSNEVSPEEMWTLEQLEQELIKLFGDEFTLDSDYIHLSKDLKVYGRDAWGRMSNGILSFRVVDGKVHPRALFHEGLHLVMNHMISEDYLAEVESEARKIMDPTGKMAFSKMEVHEWTITKYEQYRKNRLEGPAWSQVMYKFFDFADRALSWMGFRRSHLNEMFANYKNNYYRNHSLHSQDSNLIYAMSKDKKRSDQLAALRIAYPDENFLLAMQREIGFVLFESNAFSNQFYPSADEDGSGFDIGGVLNAFNDQNKMDMINWAYGKLLDTGQAKLIQSVDDEDPDKVSNVIEYRIVNPTSGKETTMHLDLETANNRDVQHFVGQVEVMLEGVEVDPVTMKVTHLPLVPKRLIDITKDEIAYILHKGSGMKELYKKYSLLNKDVLLGLAQAELPNIDVEGMFDGQVYLSDAIEDQFLSNFTDSIRAKDSKEISHFDGQSAMLRFLIRNTPLAMELSIPDEDGEMQSMLVDGEHMIGQNFANKLLSEVGLLSSVPQDKELWDMRDNPFGLFKHHLEAVMAEDDFADGMMTKRKATASALYKRFFSSNHMSYMTIMNMGEDVKVAYQQYVSMLDQENNEAINMLNALVARENKELDPRNPNPMTSKKLAHYEELLSEYESSMENKISEEEFTEIFEQKKKMATRILTTFVSHFISSASNAYSKGVITKDKTIKRIDLGGSVAEDIKHEIKRSVFNTLLEPGTLEFSQRALNPFVNDIHWNNSKGFDEESSIEVTDDGVYYKERGVGRATHKILSFDYSKRGRAVFIAEPLHPNTPVISMIQSMLANFGYSIDTTTARMLERKTGEINYSDFIELLGVWSASVMSNIDPNDDVRKEFVKVLDAYTMNDKDGTIGKESWGDIVNMNVAKGDELEGDSEKLNEMIYFPTAFPNVITKLARGIVASKGLDSNMFHYDVKNKRLRKITTASEMNYQLPSGKSDFLEIEYDVIVEEINNGEDQTPLFGNHNIGIDENGDAIILNPLLDPELRNYRMKGQRLMEGIERTFQGRSHNELQLSDLDYLYFGSFISDLENNTRTNEMGVPIYNLSDRKRQPLLNMTMKITQGKGNGIISMKKVTDKNGVESWKYSHDYENILELVKKRFEMVKAAQGQSIIRLVDTIRELRQLKDIERISEGRHASSDMFLDGDDPVADYRNGVDMGKKYYGAILKALKDFSPSDMKLSRNAYSAKDWLVENLGDGNKTVVPGYDANMNMGIGHTYTNKKGETFVRTKSKAAPHHDLYNRRNYNKMLASLEKGESAKDIVEGLFYQRMKNSSMMMNKDKFLLPESHKIGNSRKVFAYDKTHPLLKAYIYADHFANEFLAAAVEGPPSEVKSPSDFSKRAGHSSMPGQKVLTEEANDTFIDKETRAMIIADEEFRPRFYNGRKGGKPHYGTIEAFDGMGWFSLLGDVLYANSMGHLYSNYNVDVGMKKLNTSTYNAREGKGSKWKTAYGNSTKQSMQYSPKERLLQRIMLDPTNESAKGNPDNLADIFFGYDVNGEHVKGLMDLHAFNDAKEMLADVYIKERRAAKAENRPNKYKYVARAVFDSAVKVKAVRNVRPLTGKGSFDEIMNDPKYDGTNRALDYTETSSEDHTYFILNPDKDIDSTSETQFTQLMTIMMASPNEIANGRSGKIAERLYNISELARGEIQSRMDAFMKTPEGKRLDDPAIPQEMRDRFVARSVIKQMMKDELSNSDEHGNLIEVINDDNVGIDFSPIMAKSVQYLASYFKKMASKRSIPGMRLVQQAGNWIELNDYEGGAWNSHELNELAGFGIDISSAGETRTLKDFRYIMDWEADEKTRADNGDIFGNNWSVSLTPDEKRAIVEKMRGKYPDDKARQSKEVSDEIDAIEQLRYDTAKERGLLRARPAEAILPSGLFKEFKIPKGVSFNNVMYFMESDENGNATKLFDMRRMGSKDQRMRYIRNFIRNSVVPSEKNLGFDIEGAHEWNKFLYAIVSRVNVEMLNAIDKDTEGEVKAFRERMSKAGADSEQVEQLVVTRRKIIMQTTRTKHLLEAEAKIASLYAEYQDAIMMQTEALSIRTPSTNGSSGTYIKVVGFINDNGSTGYFNSSKNLLDGSDYDIDQVTVFFKRHIRQRLIEDQNRKRYTSEEKIKKNQNEIMSMFFDMYADPNNDVFTMEPINMNEHRSLTGAFKKDIFKGGEFFNDNTTNKILRRATQEGKAVGNFALALKFYSYAGRAYMNNPETLSDEISYTREGSLKPEGDPYQWSKRSLHSYKVEGDSDYSPTQAVLSDKAVREYTSHYLGREMGIKDLATPNSDQWKSGSIQHLWEQYIKPALMSREEPGTDLFEDYKDLWMVWASENATKMESLAFVAYNRVLTNDNSKGANNNARALSEILMSDYSEEMTKRKHKENITQGKTRITWNLKQEVMHDIVMHLANLGNAATDNPKELILGILGIYHANASMLNAMIAASPEISAFIGRWDIAKNRRHEAYQDGRKDAQRKFEQSAGIYQEEESEEIADTDETEKINVRAEDIPQTVISEIFSLLMDQANKMVFKQMKQFNNLLYTDKSGELQQNFKSTPMYKAYYMKYMSAKAYYDVNSDKYKKDIARLNELDKIIPPIGNKEEIDKLEREVKKASDFLDKHLGEHEDISKKMMELMIDK
ncbi:MAG: hypothetical protein ACXABY_04815, partial [Candidatus Thorarchaeota archaeon]